MEITMSIICLFMGALLGFVLFALISGGKDEK